MKKRNINVVSRFSLFKKVVLVQSEFVLSKKEDSNNNVVFLLKESLDLYESVIQLERTIS